MSLLIALAMLAQPGDVTAEEVHQWADDYAWYYEQPAHPHDELLADSLRVMHCESAGFDPAVINNRRLGRAGEVGVGQFHPRGIWHSTPQAQAGYSVRDVEANVAAVVWGIASGHARAWSCW